jgi:hypothetical protein
LRSVIVAAAERDERKSRKERALEDVIEHDFHVHFHFKGALSSDCSEKGGLGCGARTRALPGGPLKNALLPVLAAPLVERALLAVCVRAQGLSETQVSFNTLLEGHRIGATGAVPLAAWSPSKSVRSRRSYPLHDVESNALVRCQRLRKRHGTVCPVARRCFS